MSDALKITIGLLLPLLGTVSGASMVFFLRGDMKPRLRKALLGFSSGVMIAAAFWSLLIPSIEMAEESGGIAWLPATAGFLLGVFFLLFLDVLIPHLHLHAEKAEGRKSSFGKSAMLILAVTLHNIPEGMTVGVVFAGMLTGNTVITAAGAFSLAIGIAIQNFPEGAVISMPLVGSGISRNRAFIYGLLSGIVEPLGAVLMIFLASAITPVFPYILSFAAGAMVYVVVEELIPQAHEGEHSNVGTIGVAVGFSIMMVLEIALS